MVSTHFRSGFIITISIIVKQWEGTCPLRNLWCPDILTTMQSFLCIEFVSGLDFHLSVRQNSASNFVMAKCLNMGTLCLKIIYLGLSICHSFLFGYFPRIPDHIYAIFRKIFQLFRILVNLSSNFMTLKYLRIIYTYAIIFHSLISCICQRNQVNRLKTHL